MTNMDATNGYSAAETVSYEQTREHAIKRKLVELRQEFERGQHQMAVLDRTRDELRDTLLRISGAIQVLRELLDGQEQDRADANGDAGRPVTLEARNLPVEPVGPGESFG